MTRENMFLAVLLCFVATAVPLAALVQSSATSMADVDLFLVLGGDPVRLERVAHAFDGYRVSGAETGLGRLITGDPDMIPFLYENGAWFVVPANNLSFLCVSNSQDELSA